MRGRSVRFWECVFAFALSLALAATAFAGQIEKSAEPSGNQAPILLTSEGMTPQCSANSDCGAICGSGLGKCVHARCPIRICRCG